MYDDGSLWTVKATTSKWVDIVVACPWESLQLLRQLWTLEKGRARLKRVKRGEIRLNKGCCVCKNGKVHLLEFVYKGRRLQISNSEQLFSHLTVVVLALCLQYPQLELAPTIPPSMLQCDPALFPSTFSTSHPRNNGLSLPFPLSFPLYFVYVFTVLVNLRLTGKMSHHSRKISPLLLLCFPLVLFAATGTLTTNNCYDYYMFINYYGKMIPVNRISVM